MPFALLSRVSLFTICPLASAAARKATETIPIVMLAVNYDPIALDYVRSLAHPGTNVTGFGRPRARVLHRELTAKRFGLFREILPRMGDKGPTIH